MDTRGTIRYLIDNSAWSRLSHSSLSQSRAAEVDRAFLDDEVLTCLPFLLEAGYSARTGADHIRLSGYLGRLQRAPMDAEVEERALLAQAELARVGHHRVKLPDLLISAIADRHVLGVLHYDKDFDLVLQHTALRFESVWLASQGSLP